MSSKNLNQLSELFERSSVEDIVLSPKGLSFFEKGKWKKSQDCQLSNSLLNKICGDIAEQTHQQLSMTQPTVDSRFEYDSTHHFRAHIAIEPLAEEGPQITLRRLPGNRSFKIEDFVDSPTKLKIIKSALTQKRNILVSGATGSGKTSFISALLTSLPDTERVLVLEDSPELKVPNELSAKLLCRSDRFGFRTGSTWELNDLVLESLRMRPDRIVVGECRSHEAKGLLQAMNTGHAGCITSIHSGSCAQALRRFAELSQQTAQGCLPEWELQIQLYCDKSGNRGIQEIQKLWND